MVKKSKGQESNSQELKNQRAKESKDSKVLGKDAKGSPIVYGDGTYKKQSNKNSRLQSTDSQNKLKIIIFDGSFKATAFINRLIEGLMKSGHEIYVLGFNEKLEKMIKGINYIRLGSSESKFKFSKTTLYWGFKSRSILKTINYLLKGDKSYLKRMNLNAALDKIQPDIIHLQWVSHISLFEKQLEEEKFKFVLSQRGFQTNVRPFVNKANFEYLQHWLPKFAGFHSVSKAISNEGDKIYQSKDKIDQVVYTGLDLSKFEFKSEVIKSYVLKIISIGRSHWIKGYDYAIKACHLCKEKGLEFHYTIVGAAGDEELLFLIHELGLQNQVTLTDKLTQPKVFELMHTSDVLLLPSLEEGIANVAVEAMALGCPVISTDCVGMLELITHREEGWIVPKRDPEAMVDQILEFSKMDVKQIMMVKEKSRLKVELQHSEEQMIEGMMRLYASV